MIDKVKNFKITEKEDTVPYLDAKSGVKAMNIMVDKINELCDIINEIQNPCRDPEVYRIMKEKDAIIAKHIGEKNELQRELDIARGVLKKALNYDEIAEEASKVLEQINNKE